MSVIGSKKHKRRRERERGRERERKKIGYVWGGRERGNIRVGSK